MYVLVSAVDSAGRNRVLGAVVKLILKFWSRGGGKLFFPPQFWWSVELAFKDHCLPGAVVHLILGKTKSDGPIPFFFLALPIVPRVSGASFRQPMRCL